MNSTLLIMLNAFAAMAKVFIVAGIGIICALYPKKEPLLPPVSLRYLSRLSNLVLLPCLIISSLGSSISLALLNRIGVLVFYCVLNIIFSFVIANTIGSRMHESNPNLFNAVSVAIFSPNAISLPIMVFQTLCEQSYMNSRFDNDSAMCFVEANSMIFVYSIGWHFIFWSFGFSKLKQDILASSVNRDVFDKRAVWQWCNKVFLSPAMIGIYIGLFVGLIKPLQFHIFNSDGVLRPLGSALQTIGATVVCVNCFVMAASLAHSDFKNFKFQEYIEGFLFDDVISGSNSNDKDVNKSSDCELEKVDNISSKAQTRRYEAAVDLEGSGDVNDVIVVDNDNSSPSIDVLTIGQQQEQQYALPRYNSVLTLILCRLLIAPTIALLLIQISLSIGLLHSNEPMMLLLILVESAAPSAQLVIVSLNQIGSASIASNLAFMYVFQYITSILTITLWVTIGISVYYR